jgi:hypothetical protein
LPNDAGVADLTVARLVKRIDASIVGGQLHYVLTEILQQYVAGEIAIAWHRGNVIRQLRTDTAEMH